jgi:hypothetical protein
MEKYEKLLNMLMDFNDSIRFAAVCNTDGDIVWNSQRKGMKNIVPLDETKQTIVRVIEAWAQNSNLENHVGSGLYSIASYEKIKRITVPLADGNLLFISVNNPPAKNSKTKSYGQIADMGKILSIVDFVKSQK